MTNRFKDYDSEVRELILDFEEMQQHGEHRFYDVEQLEIIIDFYLETFDNDQLEHAVVYAEQLFPRSTEIRLRRSHLLCTKERYEEAYAILQELEIEEPDNTDVLYALGAILSVLDQPRKAIQYYQRASTDGCELGMVYGNIGDEYVKLGRNRDAIGYYRKSLECNPEEERAIINLANCFETEDMDSQSVAYFSTFVEEHPYNKMAWFCLGVAYRDLSLYEKAVDAFEFVTTIDNKYYEAYLQKADCYQLLGRSTQAVMSLREALPHVDDRVSIQQGIASLYMEQGNYVTALIYLKEAQKGSPSSADIWMSMALCHAQMDEYQTAVDYMEQAFKINPNEPYYLIDAARIYAHFNDEEKAVDFFEQGLELTYNDRCWTDYADFFIDHQKYDQAIDVLQRGLVNCEQPFYFNERLAVCYFLTNRRNFLFNALRACMDENKDWAQEVIEVCPQMQTDIEIMNILRSN